MQKKYKTKFPVARIKKIMRTDEEVGKVAQVTPVLISKALECFIQCLIDETCKETRARNATKMTLAHLKTTVDQVDKFDWLRGTVGGAVQHDSTAKEEEDDESGDGSKRGKGAGRGQSRGKGRTLTKKDKKEED
ncbi:hypothetical protein HDV00_003760 [Rhizophlyctis rosea]|nr:hypothetical protein HDV00_003760 [Rhizophlyctis rosea]